MIKTLKFRVKDKAKKWLIPLSKEVNFVWNYVNELSFKNIRDHERFLSAYDMHSFLVGATKEGLSLYSESVCSIADKYCICRNRVKRRKLSWRTMKSLGWIPFKNQTIHIKSGYLLYGKNKFKIWDSYGIENYKLRSGSFNEDSKGNWYFNVCIEIEDQPARGLGEIGIDLGLKDFVTLSDGFKVESQQFYRKLEPKLVKTQRANKKKRVKAIHNKIKNQRRDFLHKLSDKLTKDNRLVVVGNVNSSKLAKTNMAKSVLDAGWYMFKTMLEYKAIRRQVKFLVVNEAYTSLTCSVCNGHTGPKGLGGLGIREWECGTCKTIHDRDTNAARNILALGYQRLAEGIAC